MNLYQKTILAHNKAPLHFAVPAGANRSGGGHNAMCGDEIQIHLQLEEGVIRSAGFTGRGCAICIASGSILCACMQGRGAESAQELAQTALAAFRGSPADDLAAIHPDLQILSGVRDYPSRVKCAALAWSALCAALQGDTKLISTQ